MIYTKRLFLLLVTVGAVGCSNKDSVTDPEAPDSVTYGQVTITTPDTACSSQYEVSMDGTHLTTMSDGASYSFTTETGEHSFVAARTTYCSGVSPSFTGNFYMTLMVTESGTTGSF